MIVFRPYTPAFVVEVAQEPAALVETADELYALPQPSRFANRPGFARFTQAAAANGTMLVAEYADGSYWVVGFLSQPMQGIAPFDPKSGPQNQDEGNRE